MSKVSKGKGAAPCCDHHSDCNNNTNNAKNHQMDSTAVTYSTTTNTTTANNNTNNYNTTGTTNTTNTTITQFLCGYLAGAASEFFIYPLDTVRRRQQRA